MLVTREMHTNYTNNVAHYSTDSTIDGVVHHTASILVVLWL